MRPPRRVRLPAPRVDSADHVRVRHGARARARLLRRERASNVALTVARERRRRRAEARPAEMDEAVLADVEEARPGAALPFDTAVVEERVLEALAEHAERAAFELHDPFVDLARPCVEIRRRPVVLAHQRALRFE